MGFYCRVERHSVPARGGPAVVSYVIRYPRVVLAEEATHRLNHSAWDDWPGGVSICSRQAPRDQSKNSASSRAVSMAKMRAAVIDDPYVPEWTLNQRGMQGEAADAEVCTKASRLWSQHLISAAATHRNLEELGIHKQDANRLLEPFAWVTQVVTSTNWDNFFHQRCDGAAHPALRHIARLMYLRLRESVPDRLEHGQWHLPFVPRERALSLYWTPFGDHPLRDFPTELKLSAGRCAWVSYDNAEKDSSDEAILATYVKLVSSRPKHVSPLEHQGTPFGPGKVHDIWKSNLDGWHQFRKLHPGECAREYSPSDAEVASWGIDLKALDGESL